jgi:phospholipase C
MPSRNVTRRELLKIGATTAAAEVVAVLLPGCGGGGTSPGPAPSVCSKSTDVEDVVIFIQENRSFDQSLAFQQPDLANTTDPPMGVLLPFHLDTSKTNAACTHDITHDWVPQHQSWDSGPMDGFVSSRLPINPNDAVLTMGYCTRADLPFYYAVADAFTICDNYFCSVMGPTDPNRLYTMAASIDPAGQNGGPLLQTLVANRSSFFGKLTYTTMPEQPAIPRKALASIRGPFGPRTHLSTNYKVGVEHSAMPRMRGIRRENQCCESCGNHEPLLISYRAVTISVINT